MRRNWYAVALLALLALVLYAASRYMNTSTKTLDTELSTAYTYAEAQDYDGACAAFTLAAGHAEDYSRIWMLLTRRSLVDQLNQTLATIPSYVSEDNMADLAVETARARTQVRQINQSFFSWF